jgi:hypothetical protein
VKSISLALVISSLCMDAISQSWIDITPGDLTDISGNSFVISKNDVVIYLGGKTCFSSDGGDTWSKGTKPVVNYNGKAELLGGVTSTTVQALPDGDLIGVGHVGIPQVIGPYFWTVFLSTDHGLTWNNTLDSLPIHWELTPLMQCISAPNGNLFLFTRAPLQKTQNIFVSKDKGKTWIHREIQGWLGSCEADPESQIVCEGSLTSDSTSVLFKSPDNGETWNGLYFPRPLSYLNTTLSLTAAQKGLIALLFVGSTTETHGNVYGLTLMDYNHSTPLYSTMTLKNLDQLFHNTWALTMGPDENLYLKDDRSFVIRINKGLDQTEVLNAGAESAMAPEKMKFDTKGNLFAFNGFKLYRLGPAGNGIKMNERRIHPPQKAALFDVKGRALRRERHPGTVITVAGPGHNAP